MQVELVDLLVETHNEFDDGKTIMAAQVNRFEEGREIGNLRFSEIIVLLTTLLT